MRCGFQDPRGGGSHGDHAAGGGDFFLQTRADFVPFFVHGVIAEVGGFDGAESAQADMEGNKGVVQPGKQFRGEVESGGGAATDPGIFA